MLMGPFVILMELLLMPSKPKKPCSHPGCPNLTHDQYCEEHKQLHVRRSSTERGYGPKWQRARKQYLKAHPLCVRCKADGKMVRATVVDHIVPHRGDEKLFWDESNWQALCKRCHDTKTMTEDRNQEYKY